MEEAAYGGGAVLVADEERLSGEGLGEVAEDLRGETLVVPVELVVGDYHPADIDLVRREGAEGELVDEGEGVVLRGDLFKTGVFEGEGFGEHRAPRLIGLAPRARATADYADCRDYRGLTRAR